MGGTFKSIPQLRLEVSARIGRYMFFQQRRLPYDSNWETNLVKPLKGTPLPIEPTLYWFNHIVTTLGLVTKNLEYIKWKGENRIDS